MRILQELLAGKIGVRLIFLSGFILTYLAFFPGLMTSDSDFQLVQARSFEFSDWHPVIMSWIWSLTNFALAGPAGFFILLLSMYWFAFFLLSEYFRNRSMVAYLVSLLIPVLPVVINFSGTLWKDVLVFDCFLLALAIAVHSCGGRRTPLGIFVATLGLLTIGTLARYNSLLAAVPIFCILLIRSDYSKPVTIFGVGTRMLLSCAIVLTAFVAGNILIDRLLTPQATHPVGQIFLFDLVGVSQRIETNLLPGVWSPEESRLILSSCYEPRGWDSLWAKCGFIVQNLQSSGNWPKLFQPWFNAITSHPFQYLHHRLDYLRSLFSPAWSGHIFISVPDPAGEMEKAGFRHNALFSTIERVVMSGRSWKPTATFYSVGCWLVLPLFPMMVSVFYVRRGITACVPFLTGVSAALYTWPLVIVGAASDFRYAYWGIGGTCVSLVLVLDLFCCSCADDIAGPPVAGR
jgi:hypothetical protein